MSSRRAFIKRVVGAGAAVATAGRLSADVASSRAVGRVAGLGHVAVPMRNAEAMVAFYRALGFAVDEGESICSVHVGDHTIDFHRPSLWQRKLSGLRAHGAVPPCGDFCFVWDGTTASLRQTLHEAGAAVFEGPVEPSGRNGGRTTGTSVFVRDPDQNLIEFIVHA